MKMRNDFKVFEDKNRKGEVVWRIKLGGATGTPVTTCRTEEEAAAQARNLNIDPYFYERNQTRAARLARYT